MAEYKDSRLAFINTAAKSLGLAPGIVAAHVQLEVGSDSKTVGQFNFANIKAGKSWTGATAGLKALEYDAAGNAVREPSQFRAYQSPEEAGADYAALLQRRYPAAVGAKDAASFATALKSGGYATDPNYVNKFMEVAGGSIPAAGKAPAQPTQAVAPVPRPAMPRLDDPLAEVMPGKMRYPTGSGTKATGLSVPATPQVQGADQVAEAKTEAVASATLSKAEDVPFLEQARSSWISQTLGGAVARKVVAQDVLGENTPDPSFKLDVAALRGKSEAEQEHLQGAVNTKDFEFKLWEINQYREDTKTAAAGGTGKALLAGLVAGLPEGAITGLAAARTMSVLKAGSAAYMAQGRTGAAVGSMLAENAGLEVLMATAQNKIDPFFTTEDAVVQVGVGTLLGAAFGSASLLREGTAAPSLEALQDAQASTRLSQVLPEHADAQQAGMAAEAAALRAQEDSISRAAQPPESPVLPETVRPDFDYTSLPQGQLSAVGKGEGANDPFTAVPRTDGYLIEDGRTLPPSNFSKDDPSVFSKLFSALARVFKREDDFGTTGRADTSFEGWDSANVWPEREIAFSPGGKHAEMIPALTFGKFKTIADLDALPAGIHLADKLKNYGMAKTAAESLTRRFLGKDFKLVIADADGALKKTGANGAITHIRENLAVINIDTKLPAGKQAAVMVHELGHAIWHKFVSKLTPEGRAKVDTAYQRMVEAKGPEQARKRFANSSNGATMKGMDNSDKYSMSRDEFSAEQYVKYIEDDVLHGNKLGLGEALKNALFEAVAKMVAFFTKAKQQGFVKAEPEYEAMFDSILRRQAAVDGNFGAATAGIAVARQLSKDGGTAEANAIVGDPDLAKLGLDIAPVATTQQRAEVQAIKDLHDRAKNPEYAVDEKRLSTLLNTAVFQGGQSVANTLLRSKNAVARMIAAMLVESPSGAAGRRGNAAISKALHEQAYLGNSINEVQFAYREYRQSVGGSLVEDTFGGKHWEEFNALVSRELEGRGRSQGVTPHPAVVKGADALEAAYERMRLSQLEVKTVGWASLPSTSKGYMPHRLSQEKIRNATNEQLQALHTALTDQFIRTQEFDASFSDMLASKYIDRVKHRALGGADTPAGATHIGSSDVVEEALAATGMPAEQVRATMQRLMKAGPGHTKKRLQLDLNQTYSTASGGEFKLGDLFEQDQFTLLRSQAARVSGEVSLTQYGVYGKAGLDLLRRAMTFGEEGPASKREFEAFDQIAAEFLGTPYGTQSKVIDRVLQANAVSRLGGMGFTQLAEFINGVVHVGVGRTLDAVVGVPRLLGEIKALARGEEVQNGILAGMEKLYGGAEFGTQSYKTVFPFDNKSLDPHSYGEETITLMDRLLRGASHMQAKLSFWRAIHSAQQRGMAEQIVRKAAVFLREGQSADVFLKDMGMSDDLLARMRAELPSIASWDAQGRLVGLDVTKATDMDAAREFTQAVHRGVSQIIQGTFIGERSQWATDAHMRLLTQFRSFGLLAIEKQYGRQVGNVGEMKTLGILLGSMCAVLPIYAARMQLQSLGREDREEFLDKAFEPRRVARQTMNYVAGSGLAGDFLDALGGLAGVNVGGRQGDREQEFVGNVVAPAAGLLDDAWKAVQNVQEGETNLQPAMKVLTNLPYLVPLINAMGD